jgi:hypothetical protein
MSEDLFADVSECEVPPAPGHQPTYKVDVGALVSQQLSNDEARPTRDVAPPPPPSVTAPLGPMTPVAPAAGTTEDALRSVVREGVADALHAIGAAAYFERIARQDPRTFREYVKMLIGEAGSRHSGQQQVVQVITAIPRSRLDELPEGFNVN